MIDIQNSLEKLAKQYNQLTENKNRNITQEFAVRCKQREIKILCDVSKYFNIFVFFILDLKMIVYVSILLPLR